MSTLIVFIDKLLHLDIGSRLYTLLPFSSFYQYEQLILLFSHYLLYFIVDSRLIILNVPFGDHIDVRGLLKFMMMLYWRMGCPMGPTSDGYRLERLIPLLLLHLLSGIVAFSAFIPEPHVPLLVLLVGPSRLVLVLFGFPLLLFPFFLYLFNRQWWPVHDSRISPVLSAMGH